jgi:hypothetical protein
MSKEDWFQMLAEAADLMLKKKTQPGIGSLKIRMKMLNPNFDEKKLNFSHWSEFVAAAVKAGCVTIEGKGPEALVYPVASVLEKAGTQQKAFSVLLEVLKELDKDNKPVYHSYRSVNSKLIERKVNFNDLGFNQFKEFDSLRVYTLIMGPYGLIPVVKIEFPDILQHNRVLIGNIHQTVRKFG